MGVRVAEEGTHAELSVPVERRAAHDVSGVGNPVRLRLLAVGQTVHQVFVKAHTAIPTGQHQYPRVEPAVLLEGNRPGKLSEKLLGQRAVDQSGSDLPRLGYHPVGVGGLVECVGEGYEVDLMALGFDPIDCSTPALGIKIEFHTVGQPTLPEGATEQGSGEAVSGWSRGAHASRRHDHLGDPEVPASPVESPEETPVVMVHPGHRRSSRGLRSSLAGQVSNLQPPDPKSGVLPVELPATRQHRTVVRLPRGAGSSSGSATVSAAMGSLIKKRRKRMRKKKHRKMLKRTRAQRMRGR